MTKEYATYVCGCCGRKMKAAKVAGSGLYIPAGETRGIPYVLCPRCARLRLGTVAQQHDVLNTVELRIGPMRGSA